METEDTNSTMNLNSKDDIHLKIALKLTPLGWACACIRTPFACWGVKVGLHLLDDVFSI